MFSSVLLLGLNRPLRGRAERGYSGLAQAGMRRAAALKVSVERAAAGPAVSRRVSPVFMRTGDHEGRVIPRGVAQFGYGEWTPRRPSRHTAGAARHLSAADPCAATESPPAMPHLGISRGFQSQLDCWRCLPPAQARHPPVSTGTASRPHTPTRPSSEGATFCFARSIRPLWGLLLRLKHLQGASHPPRGEPA